MSGALTTAAQPSEYDIIPIGSDAPSTDEIIAALTPEPLQVTSSVGGQVGPRTKLRAITLRIQFQPDSYELTETAQEALNNLGAALMSDALTNYRFRLEGHSDASRRGAYDLSKHHAEGVRGYLISVFDVNSDRLETAGRSHDALLNPERPASEGNRVVLVVNLGPGGK